MKDSIAHRNKEALEAEVITRVSEATRHEEPENYYRHYDGKSIDEYVIALNAQEDLSRKFKANGANFGSRKYDRFVQEMASTYDPVKTSFPCSRQTGVDGPVLSPRRRSYSSIVGPADSSYTGARSVAEAKKPAKPAMTPLEKASASLSVSRQRVQMYESELEGTIPGTEPYNSTRRGLLASVLTHNFKLTHFNVVSELDGSNMDKILEVVHVIVDQAEEFYSHLDIGCTQGADAGRCIMKDFTIAFQVAIRELLLIDGANLSWRAVRKAAQKLADIANKAEQAMTYIKLHGVENEAGTIKLPETLQLKKKPGKQEKPRQRSRIDDYIWQSIPEVQREELKRKEMLKKMTKGEREDGVLRRMTGYKNQSSRNGTSRMVKRDETKVRATLRNITAHCESLSIYD